MAQSYFPAFNIQFTDPTTGDPLSLGKVYAYYSDGVTPAPTYNQAGNANPHPIVLDAAGCCQLKGDDSISYTIIAKSSTNAAAGSWIGVTLPSGGGGAAVTMDTIAQGTAYKKITSSQYTSLTGGSNSTLHYHSADRQWSNISSKPSTFAPSAHAATHASGQSDELTHGVLGGVALAGPGVSQGHITDSPQTIAGNKTFTGLVTASNASGTSTIDGNMVSGQDATGKNKTSVIAGNSVSLVNVTSENSTVDASTAGISASTAMASLDCGMGDGSTNPSYSINVQAYPTQSRIILSKTLGSPTHYKEIRVYNNNALDTSVTPGGTVTNELKDDGTYSITVNKGFAARFLFPEAAEYPGTYNLATREWVTSTYGNAAQAYEHSQGVASLTWTIFHNLGHYPIVQCWDSSGAVINGSIQHDSTSKCTVTFASSQSGGARLI